MALMTSLNDLKEGIVLQYRVAKQQRKHDWVKEIRLSCQCDLPDDWIEENIPSLDGKKLSKKAPKKTARSTYAAGPTSDIRLLNDPTMPVYRANAADDSPLDPTSGEPSSTGERTQDEVKTEFDHLDLTEPPSTLREGAHPTVSSTAAAASQSVDASSKMKSQRIVRPQASGGARPKTGGRSQRSRSTSADRRDESRRPCLQSEDVVWVPAPRRDDRRIGMSGPDGESLSITVSGGGEAKKRSAEKSTVAATGGGEAKKRSVEKPPVELPSSIFCLLSTCESMDKRPKRHAVSKHLPLAFGEVSVQHLDPQIQALRWLIRTAFGSQATLWSAVDHVNRSGMIPPGCALNPLHSPVFTEACRLMGISTPREFTLHQVNSPAVLLFWRCLIAILNSCTREQQIDFYQFSPEGGATQHPSSKESTAMTAPSRDSTVAEAPRETIPAAVSRPEEDESDMPPDLEEFILVDEADSDGSNDETVQDDVPKVYDSHFHLDRSSKAIWNREVGHTVEDLIEYRYSNEVSYKPSVHVQVAGGVIVYSEPRNYPDPDFQIKGPWKVAVGVHPKHFETLTVERHMRLQQLLGHPKVVALGEIGMDRTIPMAKWSRQDEVFKRMLQIAKIDQPLVIHLRGTKGDESGIDIHGRCLMMMEVVCNRQQKIHVHCFKGSVEVVKAWLRKFPNVYFGVTAAVRCFDRDQRAGLQATPSNKLLLETDAPYFPLGNAHVSTPAYLGEVAAFVAVHLNVRPPELMQATLDNARALYG